MIIETERLIFRAWTMDDIEFLVDGLNDYDVAKNLTVPFPYTISDAVDFVSKHLENNPSSYYFGVVRKDDGKLIGGTNVSINDIGEYHGGIWLHRDYQGSGYGTEVWTARAKFAFDIMGADTLINGYFHFNVRSKRMQLKVGGEIVGEKLNYCPALQSDVKEIVTKLTRENFDRYYSNIEFKFSVEK